jgi:uncharacterized protein (TIGR02284 family)
MATTPSQEDTHGYDHPSHAVVRAINRCIEACIDSEKDYGLAAADVRNPELKALFLECERQRAGFVSTLQNAVRGLGAFPENEASTSGIAHRGFAAVARVLSGRNERMILVQAVDTEERALRAYREVLDGTPDLVPSAITFVLEHQRAAMRDTQTQLRTCITRSPYPSREKV